MSANTSISSDVAPTTAHYIALATQRQIAGLVAERDALRQQVAGLVAERDALRRMMAEATQEQEQPA